MKTILLTIFATLTLVALLAAATTRINISQILGGGTGTFILQSVNGVPTWAPPIATTIPNFADAEVPSGPINGANTSFTLLHANGNTGSSLVLIRNGIVQTINNDYTLTGNAIQFSAGSIPQAQDTLLAWYRY